jgi:hypothetical protein
MALKYDTERRDFAVTTPLTMIRPEAIRVVSVSSGVMAHYQKLMSKAVWRPAPGRKLGFLVMQDENLLGLIFLASPVIRLSARDEYIWPEKYRNQHLDAKGKFNYGTATREYMDMSVCVSSQPVGWHWNLGKLMAMLAPTLGNYVETRYPLDKFKGVTTTSLYGKSVQYNRIYKLLGYTKGHGHEHIDDVEYKKMIDYLRDHCVHCNPRREETHEREWWADWLIPLKPRRNKRSGEEAKETDPESWCAVPGSRFGDGANARMRVIQAYAAACAVPSCNFEEGSNPKMRRIAAFASASGDKSVTLTHGNLRGVYYHAAVPCEQRQAVIQSWYERWGLPRYERTKHQQAPYQSGLDGPEKEHKRLAEE